MIITGMGLPPKGCIKRLLVIREWNDAYTLDTTPEKAPPIEDQHYATFEIPPHGDLIDRDVFMKEIASLNDLRRLSTKTIGEALSRTPVVIPGDKQ